MEELAYQRSDGERVAEVHSLTGPIGADDGAQFELELEPEPEPEGIVNNPAYAIDDAQRGKPYSYRARARFGATEGTGSRVGKRKCQFQFNRTG